MPKTTPKTQPKIPPVFNTLVPPNFNSDRKSNNAGNVFISHIENPQIKDLRNFVNINQLSSQQIKALGVYSTFHG